ncbi:hypothetical protein ACFQX7_27750 [Luedemannella flava]
MGGQAEEWRVHALVLACGTGAHGDVSASRAKFRVDRGREMEALRVDGEAVQVAPPGAGLVATTGWVVRGSQREAGLVEPVADRGMRDADRDADAGEVVGELPVALGLVTGDAWYAEAGCQNQTSTTPTAA